MKRQFHRAIAVWFGVALLVMLGVTAISYAAFTQTARMEAEVVHSHAVIDNLNDLLVELANLQIGSYGYAITGTVALLEPYEAGKARVDRLLDRLANKVQDNADQLKRVKALRAHVAQSAVAFSTIVSAREIRGFEQARMLVGNERARGVLRETSALMRQMIEDEERLLVRRISASNRARNLALIVGAIGVLTSIVIIVLIFALIRREGSRRLSAEGELFAANEQLSSSLRQAEALLQERRLLDHVGALLHSCKSIEGAKDVVSKEVRRALPDFPGAVYLFRNSRNLVEMIAHWSSPHALESGLSFSPEDCWALKRGSQHVLHAPADLACPHIDTMKVHAAVCTPMIVHGEIIGVMHLEAKPGQLTQPALDLTRRFAEEIGMSLAALRLQETLRHQSLHDPLTGLVNRRFVEEALPREVSRAHRQGQSMGFLMVDIDHFKMINDRYGHAGGDTILREVAGVLRRQTRLEDVVSRYGGEEFFLLLTNATLAVAQERAQALCSAVAELVISLDGGETVRGTTISIGLAIYPHHGSKWQDVLAIADTALYRAKEEGRNRFIVAS